MDKYTIRLVNGSTPEPTVVLRMNVELSRNPFSEDEAALLWRIYKKKAHYMRSYEKAAANRLACLGLATRLPFGRYILTPLGVLALDRAKERTGE